jgi:hypothetical protein
MSETQEDKKATVQPTHSRPDDGAIVDQKSDDALPPPVIIERLPPSKPRHPDDRPTFGWGC